MVYLFRSTRPGPPTATAANTHLLRPLNRLLLLLLISLTAGNSLAANFLLPDRAEILDPRRAFVPQLQRTGAVVNIKWQIAPGYYLYRDKTEIHLVTDAGRSPLTPGFAAGELVDDEELGSQTVFRHFTVMTVETPVAVPPDPERMLEVTFQGCKEGRLCYPPTQVTLAVPADAMSVIPEEH